MNLKYILFLIMGVCSSALSAADAESLESQSVQAGFDLIMNRLPLTVATYCKKKKINCTQSLLPVIGRAFRTSSADQNTFLICCNQIADNFNKKIRERMMLDGAVRTSFFEIFRTELKKTVGEDYYNQVVGYKLQQEGFECAFKTLLRILDSSPHVFSGKFSNDVMCAAATLYGRSFSDVDVAKKDSITIPLGPDRFAPRSVPGENISRMESFTLTVSDFGFPSR